MTPTIIRIPNPEHMGRCVQAIRERWANEARFERVQRVHTLANGEKHVG